MQVSREQFFKLLQGETTIPAIAERRAWKARALRVGRRQNEIEQVFAALPLDDLIAFKTRTHLPMSWEKLLNTPEHPNLPVTREEWDARKQAFAKVWPRRVHQRDLPVRTPRGRAARRVRAMAARGQGKTKNR